MRGPIGGRHMAAGDGGFAPGEARWRERQGHLRNVVRQELVARRLADHVPDRPARRVLDVGCGQGTQAVLLARRGHRVVGLDRSERLLQDFEDTLAAEPPEVRTRVRLVRGDVADLGRLFPPAGFDAVLCHGVLMYLPDPEPLLAGIAATLAPDGVASLLVRNGDALAMRPGIAGDWPAAARAFAGTSYVNRLGVTARADRLGELTATLARQGLAVRAWYGVRVFTDHVPDDAAVPAPEVLAELLACEERAGGTDPYRAVAPLLHVIAEPARPVAQAAPDRD